MIKSVKVTNHLGESITLDLGIQNTTGLLIEKIEGLGAAKADINMSELANADGGLYNSARLNPRNIVFGIKLDYAPTIEDARLKSYKYFPIKQKIKLVFTTDNRVSTIYGYVESNVPNIFSRRETTQISVICPDPYFYDEGEEVTISGNEPSFQFPFSNESLSESLITMGRLNLGRSYTINYVGDAEVGVFIYIYASGSVENLTLYNSGDGRYMFIDTAKLLALTGDVIINGDVITISTKKGQKYIQLVRAGIVINILNTLSRDSEWLTLVRGNNVFAFSAEAGTANLELKIEHQTTYEGV